MISVVAVVLATAVPPPPRAEVRRPVPAVMGQASRAPAPQAAPSARSDAYYQFLLGRHLEMAGEVEAAIKAYGRAAALDPTSAAIPAEVAALYARQNRAQDAVAAADKALTLDPDNVEAHRVLGLVYGAMAQSETPDAPMDRASADYARQAISHLEAVARGPGLPEPGVLLTLGRLDVRTGQFEKAVSVLSRLMEQVQGSSDAGALLAEAQAGAGHPEEAIHLLEGLVANEPDLYGVLGEMYERVRRWKDAAGAYGKALERSPSTTDLRTNLAFALLNAGEPADLPRARDLCNAALKEKANDPRALYVLAQVQRTMHDLNGAEATARQLTAVGPEGLTGPFLLAEIFEDRGEYQKVVDLLQPIVARQRQGSGADSDLVRLVAHLGAAHSELGQYDQAISCFEDLRQRAPNDAAVEAALIQAYLGARRFDQAASLAAGAAGRHPGNLRFAELEADALRQQGQIDRAVAIMREAVRQHPSNPIAHVALSELLVSGGRPAEALAAAREAEGKFPKDTSVLFELGVVLERQKKYSEAEQMFKKVLGEDPLHAQALNYLGYMLADRGERLDESVKYIERALAIDPGNGAYLDSLGWANFKLNKLDLAEGNLRQAAEQRRRDSVIQDHFAQVLFKLGRYQEAVAAWERALAGDGEQIDRSEIAAKIRAAREKAARR